MNKPFMLTLVNSQSLTARLSILLTAAILATGCLFETRQTPPKILFIGNSITLTNPTPAFGWTHAWGASATALDKDYVHLTMKTLANRGLPLEYHLLGRNCNACDGVIGEYMENIYDVQEMRPQYVVVQLGENSNEAEALGGKLTAQYRQLLESLLGFGIRKIYCISVWAEGSLTAPHNAAIQRAMNGLPNVKFVDITPIAANPSANADTTIYLDPSVRWHPGDIGMAYIAKALSDSILNNR